MGWGWTWLILAEPVAEITASCWATSAPVAPSHFFRVPGDTLSSQPQAGPGPPLTPPERIHPHQLSWAMPSTLGMHTQGPMAPGDMPRSEEHPRPGERSWGADTQGDAKPTLPGKGIGRGQPQGRGCQLAAVHWPEMTFPALDWVRSFGTERDT